MNVNNIVNFVIPEVVKKEMTIRMFDAENLIHLVKEKKSNINENHEAINDNNDNANILEEIDEIVNELELFERERRKRRTIKLIEKIAEHINEDLIDIDEFTDYMFYGDKIENIEKRIIKENNDNKDEMYLNERKESVNNEILCLETNKLLEEDNEIWNNLKNY